MRVGLAVAAIALMGSVPAWAGIDRIDGPVPVTATSQIYNSANVPGALPVIDLAAHGYVEEEYFLHGTADAFRHEADGTLSVLTKDVPYGTRIIVRRPKDDARSAVSSISSRSTRRRVGRVIGWRPPTI